MSRDRTARARIRQFLATSGSVVDPSGYATSLLKDAIGYSGSAVAFIQLIAAMDRDNEIEREIRGKRTYRISGVGAPETVVPSQPGSGQAAGVVTTVSAPGQPVIELDYTKLAQALVRELLVATAAAGRVAEVARDDHAENARLSAEREDYVRRLERARNQLDALLGESAGSLDHPALGASAND